MPGDPKECRDHAKTCLRLAAETRKPEAREVFESLARTWLRLACDRESSTLLLKEWGEDSVLPRAKPNSGPSHH
jgi:hypothetical protein